MLAELNVKDIALIRQAGVEFENGLNILTGETGAGKSVIIGSALLSLGTKARSDMIREGAESAYSELVFTLDDEERCKKVRETGVDVPEDGTLIFSRKISEGRSISRINGETVPLSVLKNAASLLIDIYGQNEYHTLFDTDKHLELLDSWIGKKAEKERKEAAEAYRDWQEKKEHMASFMLDESERLRELSLAEYEINEIDEAKIKPGEEEELAVLYKKLNNGRNLEEYLSQAYRSISEMEFSEVIRSLTDAMRYDEGLSGIRQELLDAQSILEDAGSEIRHYVSDLDLSEEMLENTEKRLNLIRDMEARYGRDAEEIAAYRERKEARRKELEEYDANRLRAEKELKASRETLEKKAEVLSGIRKKEAEGFCEAIRKELLELGFSSVTIRLDFTEKEPARDGKDSVVFMVALNPGESVKPLSQVASGGELSRVMLSIKTVLAGSDDIPTLIFDEIDAGISGRTAQKVAEKLDLIARNRQVICITHLPQIASMADAHFVIRKDEENGRNVTTIERLDEAQSEEELARLLGGAKVTEAVKQNASEMKRFAAEIKREHRNG